MLFINDLVADRAWIAPAPLGYVEPGWKEIVSDLIDTLGHAVAASPDTMIDIVDVRERDGRLAIDVVVDPVPDPAIGLAVAEAVSAAENRSTTVCARCGRPGRLRVGRVMLPTTRCDAHAP